MATDTGGLFASSGFLQLAPNHCHCSSIRQTNRKTRPPIIITAITWAWARITRLDLPLPPLCLPHSCRAQDQLPWRDGDRDGHWRMHKPTPLHSACCMSPHRVISDQVFLWHGSYDNAIKAPLPLADHSWSPYDPCLYPEW